MAEGIFDVMAVFNATMEYVLYYHSGRKTIRAFRRKDGKMIANFRVQADLKGMETTTDGRFFDRNAEKKLDNMKILMYSRQWKAAFVRCFSLYGSLAQ